MIKELLKIVIGFPVVIGTFYLLALLYGFLYNLLSEHFILLFFMILGTLYITIVRGIKRGDI